MMGRFNMDQPFHPITECATSRLFWISLGRANMFAEMPRAVGRPSRGERWRCCGATMPNTRALNAADAPAPGGGRRYGRPAASSRSEDQGMEYLYDGRRVVVRAFPSWNARSMFAHIRPVCRAATDHAR
jgi:hypothetical protein